jgi:hypothetical protein
MKATSEELSSANELAVGALVFMAADPDRLGRFLALSGIDPQSIRLAAREPGFLAGVLEHISGDEKLLLAFAAENGVRPEDIARARRVLVGPAEG